MKFFYAPLIVIALTGDLQASIYPVRTGEHGLFTRLVVAILKNETWDMTQDGDYLRFEHSTTAARFDISEAFDRINRNRIKSVSTQKNVLIINLGCECGVRTLQRDDGLVVIDVSEAYFGEEEINREEDQTNIQPSSVAVQELLLAPVNSHTSGRLEEKNTGYKRSIPRINSNKNEELSLLQRRISENLGSATSRGLLIARLGNSAASSNLSQYIEKQSTGISDKKNKSEKETDTAGNITFSNSMQDLGESDQLLDERYISDGRQCPNPQLLQLEKWAISENFLHEISSARNDLFTDIDSISVDAAINLAKTYIYFGFMEEALLTLSLVTNDDDRTDILRGLTDVISSEENDNDTINKYSGCGEEAKFWTFIGKKDETDAVDYDPSEIVKVYNKLPSNVRELLSSKIKRQLRVHGFESYRQVVERVEKRSLSPDLFGQNKTFERNVTSDLQDTSKFGLSIDRSVLSRGANDLVEEVLSRDPSSWGG